MKVMHEDSVLPVEATPVSWHNRGLRWLVPHLMLYLWPLDKVLPTCLGTPCVCQRASNTAKQISLTHTRSNEEVAPLIVVVTRAWEAQILL